MRLGQHTSPSAGQRTAQWTRLVVLVLLALVLGGGASGACLLGCSRRATSSDEVPVNQAPAWTYRLPEDPKTLLGLGRAPIAGDTPKARQTARALALDDLMEAVREQSLAWALQNNRGVDAATLTGLSQGVRWERQEALVDSIARSELYDERDRGRIWVLLSVDRAKVDEALNDFQRRLPGEVESSLGRADTGRRKGNLAQELTGLSTALSLLLGPEGLTLPSPQGPQRLLRQDVEARLHEALKPVEISIEEAPTSLPPGLVNARLVAKARDPQGSSADLPVAFVVTHGEGELGEPTGPDSRGRTATVLKSLGPRAPEVVIRANPDLGGLVHDDLGAKMLSLATTSWDLPTADIVIQIIPVKLMLTYLERGGTGGERGTRLSSELNTLFSDLGAQIVQPPVQALVDGTLFEAVAIGAELTELAAFSSVDMVGVARVAINAYGTEGRSPQMHNATGEGSFRLYDVRNKRYAMEISTGVITFAGFSQTDAERGLFFQASDRLRDLVLTELQSRDVLN